MLIDAKDYGHFWRREALEKREDVEELKRKYAQASESITNFIPSFVNQFEKAKEQVDMILFFGTPDEVVAFIDSCESVFKRFQKKKMRLLSHGFLRKKTWKKSEHGDQDKMGFTVNVQSRLETMLKTMGN
ncbi:hypothetical protein PIB30_091449 [Stylosanthes scabra]|uniref:Uncharacterized protein n=1 Tax=Stylosanthes scabra TaxID=79078 RepID=A0ABU6ZT67_9FABA|nr:hypothetical protein [Stylosanthes scabra]